MAGRKRRRVISDSESEDEDGDDGGVWRALARRCAAPALGAGEVAARGRALGGGGREDPVLLAACPSLAVAIWGSMFI